MQFLNEVKIELGKVAWPKFDEFVGSTIVVLFLVFAFAVYLGLVDVGFSGAGNGTRTRNLQLGRLSLYQLSYSRNLQLFGGESRIRTCEGKNQRIYSPSPLTTRAPLHGSRV